MQVLCHVINSLQCKLVISISAAFCGIGPSLLTTTRVEGHVMKCARSPHVQWISGCGSLLSYRSQTPPHNRFDSFASFATLSCTGGSSSPACTHLETWGLCHILVEQMHQQATAENIAFSWVHCAQPPCLHGPASTLVVVMLCNQKTVLL
jgi:hypothetical protein